ncbi:chemotaxis protein CheW [Methylotenera versatilis]|uniref:CheW protein n=1 Tax=Methylotenera versatilis (strain 301) TaxID=666681 RepID=D7DIU1_METV0|nr:chemotaxis protein CheW [Methylotenera versatilis]ADI29976.1 CheW protein [Methylotenera versatilis 301]
MSQITTIQLDNFLPYMRDVIRCEQSLHELNLMWRMIESSAKMNCPTEAKSILPTMAATRAGFNRLEKELVLSLVQEKVATVLSEIGTKAQYVIDILVRNLYERTADVGFLATDNELCEFVAGISGNDELIRARLRAYRKKYTVYDEIILLDINGNVLVQINDETPIEGSLDPLIKETLASDQYVETYRASDLRPSKNKALIYSKRMRHPHTGEVIGVLCLCFDFVEEMASIFKSHGDPSERSVMLLLDSDNCVIESSDKIWVPVGAVVPVNDDMQSNLKVFSGRKYLVSTFTSDGYQGYMGPKGWQGQVMIPVDIAFTGKETNTLKTLDPVVAEGLLSHAQSFCPPLFEVMNAASTIRRVVWNGQVMTAGQSGELLKLKTVLDQISETGTRSNELFAQSINDLYETVLASRLQDSEFVSHLLVDLLDRNLYERSDDCRWWAVTPELRAALASQTIDSKTVTQITDILEYINSLYTVYSRIFVYDNTGCIIASTNPMEASDSIIGTRIDETTLAQVMSLRTEQQYYVSPFVNDALYSNAPTYIYHAAIMAPNGNSVVGGIGIVFDSSTEFFAMLQGGITEKESVTAFYIDRQGLIISSTDPTRPVGTMLEIDTDLLTLPNGKSTSRIVIHDGHYSILGCSVSNGYREFKVTDGYKEDVIAVVYDSFGEVRSSYSSGNNSASIIDVSMTQSADPEFATFFIDGGLFAIEAEYILEALPASEVSRVSIGSGSERVGVLAIQHENEGKTFAWVFDLGFLLSGKLTVVDSNSQVIVIEYQQHKIGLLVGALHSVAQFNESQVTPTPLAVNRDGVLIKQIIKANSGRLLIQAIDIQYLLNMLSNPFEAVGDDKKIALRIVNGN